MSFISIKFYGNGIYSEISYDQIANEFTKYDDIYLSDTLLSHFPVPPQLRRYTKDLRFQLVHLEKHLTWSPQLSVNFPWQWKV